MAALVVPTRSGNMHENSYQNLTPHLTGRQCAVAGDRYNYLQIRYADIHADISADIYLHNFVHIGISADIPSICRYGTLSADIALYLQIWYVLQIY